jgi:hypothetical protein
MGVKEFTNFNSVLKIIFCLLVKLPSIQADDFPNPNAYLKIEFS